MRIVNVQEPKTQLSKLIETVETVEAGEDGIITRAGRPAVRLTRLHAPAPCRQLGALAGKIAPPADFDAPLPRWVPALFDAGE